MHFFLPGNVGYKKVANQSGEKSNYWSKKFPANNAIDGNTDPDLEHHSCAHPVGTNAWWMIDLGKQFSIDRVVIYNRKGAGSKYTIWIDQSDILNNS